MAMYRHASVLMLSVLIGGVIVSSAPGENATIPGGRGELVKPMIPGPPTYQSGEARTDSSVRNPGEEAGWSTCGESPSRSYLDPARAASTPALNADRLYAGWRANELIGEDVYDADGEQVGEVRDILVGADRRITAITVETGGFLELGDGAFRVPWTRIERGEDRVTVDMRLDEAKRADLFGPERAATEEREFRVSEVLGDWTRIGNQTLPCPILRGYVFDLVMDREGRLMAVLESRSRRLGGGLYAYPFLGYESGWRPHYGYYDLPLEHMEKPAPRVQLDRFDDVTASVRR